MGTSSQPLFVALRVTQDKRVVNLAHSPHLQGAVNLAEAYIRGAKEKYFPNLRRWPPRTSWVGHDASIYIVLDEREDNTRDRRFRYLDALQMTRQPHPEVLRESLRLPNPPDDVG